MTSASDHEFVLRRHLRSQWPLWTATVLSLSLTLSYVITSWHRNGGHLAYALDDAYIHLAISKNLALNGNWGVSPHEFASSSSSLAWTILIAALIKITGAMTVHPLIVNLGASLAILFVADRMLTRYAAPPSLRIATLILLVVAAPLGTLVLIGMEHALHLLVTLLFLDAFGRHSQARGLREAWPVVLWGALLPLLRYEGIFIVAVAAAWFLLGRAWRVSLALVAAATIPITVYGLYSLAQGWLFLPNSVFLKGARPSFSTGRQWYDVFLWRPISSILGAPHFAIVVTGALSLLWARWHRNPHDRGPIPAMLTAFLGAAYGHAMFAGVGWFFRYEAYLIGSGLVLLAVAARPHWPRMRRPRRWAPTPTLVALVLLIVLSAPFLDRAYYAHQRTPWAATNIYEQQVQMGRFLGTYYAEEVVVLNDVGAAHAYGDIHGIDLIGLTTLEVAEVRLRGEFDTAFIHRFTQERGAAIAIIYEHWFVGREAFPSSWKLAGRWKIDHNVVAAGDWVSFYAVDGSEWDGLVANLRDFAPKLPARVHQAGPYMENFTVPR